MLKLLVSLFISANVIASQEAVTVDRDRLVKVIDVIDFSVLAQAGEISALSSLNKNPIYILINSPGGSVAAGDLFISALNVAKARGVEINCISTVMSASMAYTILLHCDKRYVLSNTLLLFHPVRTYVDIPVTAPVAAELALDLDKYDQRLLEFYRSKMKMKEEELLANFYAETMWIASDLAAASPGTFKVIKTVTNLPEMFTYRKEKNSIFDKTNNLRDIINSVNRP